MTTYKKPRFYWEDAPEAPEKPPARLVHDSATPEGRQELREALAAHNATIGKKRPSPHFDPTKVDPRAQFKRVKPYWAEHGEDGVPGQMDAVDRQTFKDVRPSLPKGEHRAELRGVWAEVKALLELVQPIAPTAINAAPLRPRSKPSKAYWETE